MFQKSYKFQNKYEGRCFKVLFAELLTYFFRQTKVSTKHYKISFGINYSVRDVICDVHWSEILCRVGRKTHLNHYCAWAAKLRYA